MKILSTSQRSELLDLAQSVLDRLESDRLTRVPLLHLDELPPIAGVYLAATEDNQILYIGKASDFTDRCKLSTHHKLPTAIEKGAVFLYVASVPSSQAWHVEQWLIDAIAPALNESVSRWWVEAKPKKSPPAGFVQGSRKKANYRFDDRILDALKRAARKAGMSINGYAESVLFTHLKGVGELPLDAEPLPEARGGRRPNAGKKSKKAEAAQDNDLDDE